MKQLSPAQTRILICDELSPAALEVLRSKGFEPEIRLGLTEDELVQLVPGVHALLVRSATKVTRRVIAAAPELRVIGRAGVGVDNVDTDAATERGVVVMNTPTGNTTTTAELAVALICALARFLPKADRTVRAGTWTKKGMMGTEICGKTLGVVGLGRIGRVVADRGLGLKMKVLAYDPFLSSGPAPGLPEVELVDLDTLLARADFVTLHVPMSDATKNLIGTAELARMKKGARLVNAARGGLVDEAALLTALEKGHLAGAALDVFAEEPPPKDHPLLRHENVISTPHLGASSHEAQFQVAVDIADQIAAFFLEGVANNAVNAPAVSARDLADLAPYVLLAEKMGSLLAQLGASPIRKLELSLAGEIAKQDARHVPLALLLGVLRAQGMDEGVNFVNAPIIAKERALELFERRDDSDPLFQTSISVRATSDDGKSHAASGTLHARKPRIVLLDGLELELEPKGPILLTRHDDQPGVLGLLGTVLGNQRVNIRRIELGPATEMTPGGHGLATGVLSLYSEPSAQVLTQLRSLEPVHEVRLIRL